MNTPSPLNPFVAWIAYKGRGTYMIEEHPIVDNRFGSARSPDFKVLGDIAKAITRTREKQQFTIRDGRGLLYHNPNTGKLVWTTHAQPQPMIFHECLGIRNGIAPQPQLLWALRGNALDLYAINKRGLLCYAPYFNVSIEGHVCLAAGEKPKHNSYPDLANAYMAAFWNSAFTHPTDDLSRFVVGLDYMWENLMGRDKFPDKWLAPMKPLQSIDDFLTLL